MGGMLFKKTAIVLCTAAVLAGIIFLVQLYRPGTQAISYSGSQEQPAGAQEELYKDMFVTALHPHIDKAIAEYYGQSLRYGLESVDIQEIKRPYGYRTFEFEVKLQVKPFVGAHNTVGTDNITITLQPGQIEVEKFEHIQSFELPRHLQKSKDSSG